MPHKLALKLGREPEPDSDDDHVIELVESSDDEEDDAADRASGTMALYLSQQMQNFS